MTSTFDTLLHRFQSSLDNIVNKTPEKRRKKKKRKKSSKKKRTRVAKEFVFLYLGVGV